MILYFKCVLDPGTTNTNFNTHQVPRTSETYVHRSGRTARATKEGLSLLLIGPDDMMNFKKIYKTLGKDEELPIFPIENKCMEAIKVPVRIRSHLFVTFRLNSLSPSVFLHRSA